MLSNLIGCTLLAITSVKKEKKSLQPKELSKLRAAQDVCSRCPQEFLSRDLYFDSIINNLLTHVASSSLKGQLTFEKKLS